MRMILGGAEEALGDGEAADGVVGDDSPGVADHVGVALLQAQGACGVETGVHASQDRQLLSRGQRQVTLGEAGGVALVVGEQLVGDAHGSAPSWWVRRFPTI
jgi:hypothetical protein